MTEGYRIGPFVLNAETCVLTRDGAPVPLGKRAVAVLTVLVRSAQEYVPKAQILEAAWPGLVVQESNLAVQILSIRRAFATVADGENWLETLSRRGYRFVGPVAALSPQPADETGGGRSRSNLAEPLTSFIGRERELAEIAKLLPGNRLVTLTGAGGVGKTRLATRVAQSVASDYDDGVWLIELAALSDPGLVPQVVTTVFALKEQPGKRLAQTLTDFLSSKRLLLVVDNAEHVLTACAQLADTLLRHCPRVKLLVTSRERLAVPGELTYRVPSMAVPEPTHDASAQSLTRFDSVRLFVERARLHKPEFAVTDENAAAIASICRRLDGIALAIELAAARVRSMSPQELNDRLEQRFALLIGGARTLPPRQQTLRAAIDWSFDLLSDTERTLLGRVSLFAGGFALDAAERVCADEDVAQRQVLDLLAALVDKSLVVVEERAGVSRYRLLETVQQYASERLPARGEAGYWIARHVAYFLDLAEAAEPELTGKDQQAWLDRLETEHDNLRSALARSLASGEDASTGLRLATAFARFWLVRGYLAEGRGWLSRLLAVPRDGDKAIRAKALNWAGALAWKQGDYPAARESYEQSLAIRQELGDRRGVGAVLNNQGLLAYEQGDFPAARKLHEASLAIDRELGDTWGIAISLIHLGGLASSQGDTTSARALYEESLATFRQLGDHAHIANAIRGLAGLCLQQGDHATARSLYEESLAICRTLGDRSGIAWALNGLGVSTRLQGDYRAAHALHDESLAIYRDLGDREGIAGALRNRGEVALASGDAASARALCAESLALYRDLGDRSGIAAAVEGLAAAASASARSSQAATLWGAAERLREEIGAPVVVSDRDVRERTIAAARAALADDAAFDRAWTGGRAMTLEAAIARALEGVDA